MTALNCNTPKLCGFTWSDDTKTHTCVLDKGHELMDVPHCEDIRDGEGPVMGAEIRDEPAKEW